MKKWMLWLLIATLLCPLLGCSRTNNTSIWIVTEESRWDLMNGQILAVQKAFEKAHPGIKIRLDILPTEEKERSAYLQQLRTQITQGHGPDAYLLPTDNGLSLETGYLTVEPLFSDVVLAMKNGMFRDISQWYDADADLGKDSLNTAIMDAGVLEGNRYVLPLRYDIPVIYAQQAVLEEAGFDLSSLEKPLSELMQAALSTGNAYVAAGGLFTGSQALTGWINYAEDRITLTEEDLTSYIESYRRLTDTARDHYLVPMDVRSYVLGSYDKFVSIFQENNYHGAIRYPLYIGSLAKLLDYAPISQYEEGSYTLSPLKTGNGSIATVTYYAAMGSGCRNPELTYAFLRQFLSEDSQWEHNRPTKANIIIGNPPRPTHQDTSNKAQTPGLIENGWPVRTKNSLAPLWDMRRKQFYTSNMSTTDRFRYRQVGLTPLEEQWAQLLDAAIVQVRFPSTMDTALETALNTLDIPAQEIAQQFLWDLRRHISEG